MLKTFIFPFDAKLDIHVNSFLPARGNHLFTEPRYYQLHSRSDNDCYAQLVRRNDSRVHATLAFHETAPGVYMSPGVGTFGGLSLNDELEFLTVEKFLQVLVDHLRQRDAHMIRFRCAPASHDGSLFTIVFNVLTRQGFQPERPDVNYDMRIDSRTFIERIDYGNVKRIRKTERASFVCERAEVVLLPEVHQLVANNRARQGISISMSLKQLQQMAELFPERMHLFATYREASRKEMVAAAVCLTIAPNVLYVLYWGDADGMRNYSPVAMLAACIYTFCAEQGYKLLDVGISTVYGEPNHGLINFKRNLGFTESLKIEMVWTSQLGKVE
jgi:hypothetical protein